MRPAVLVLKIGGSVLSTADDYRRAAAAIADRLAGAPGARLVVVVSAAAGVTDALLAEARAIVDDPDAAALDLLWSTGELRSVALLSLSLQALGVSSAAASVHQSGLSVADDEGSAPGAARLNPLRLRVLLSRYQVVIVPGFLARSAGDAVASLGRGGSDLTAVLLAAGLDTGCCELLKDVPGYFTADPRRHREARPLPRLSYAQALAMADAGSRIVQRAALDAARRHGVELIVSGIHGGTTTRIDERR